MELTSRILSPAWALLLAAGLLAACSDPTADDTPTGDDVPAPTDTSVAATVEEQSSTEPDTVVAPAGPAPTVSPVIGDGVAVDDGGLQIQTGVDWLTVSGLLPGLEVSVVDPDGAALAPLPVENGSVTWEGLAAGIYDVQIDGFGTSDGVAVAVGETSTMDLSGLEVAGAEVLDDPDIVVEYRYITVRDGTTLAALVSLPGPPESGPYPTVIEYSGYSHADPNTRPGQLYNAHGYAHVAVTGRGNGCSGGTYEFLGDNEATDGYDVIEAVAREPWVAHGHVGMVGVSYPGITQLAVGAEQPPSLAAITPIAVLGDGWNDVVVPGGIPNTGFAQSWAAERDAESAPYGQGWEQRLVGEGDEICESNQALHADRQPLVELLSSGADGSATAAVERLDLSDGIVDITVPVFLAGTWQDEQTGAGWIDLIDGFESSPAVFTAAMNGSHGGPMGNPASLGRLLAFLDLYVAQRVPEPNEAAAASIGLPEERTADLGFDRFEGLTYDEALQLFESEQGIHVLLENGSDGDGDEGGASHRTSFRTDAWPPPQATEMTYALAADGLLVGNRSAPVGAESYVSDPMATPATSQAGWATTPDAHALTWTTAPFDSDAVIIGPAELIVDLDATASTIDLEVTVSEVRADGTEVYVQSGWQRVANTGAAPVTVRTQAFAHPVRRGSQLRLTLDAPGGAMLDWSFGDTQGDGATITAAYGGNEPSRFVVRSLPATGLDLDTRISPCGWLAAQPCRQTPDD